MFVADTQAPSLSTQLLDVIARVASQPTLDVSHWLYESIAIGILLITAWLAFVLIHALLRSNRLLALFNNQQRWDDALLEHGFFRRLGHLVPAVVLFLSAPLLLLESSIWLAVINKVALVYIVFAAIFAIYALLNTLEDLYETSKLAEKAPITGFIQVTKLIFAIIAVVMTISLLLEKSPFLLLSGLTAIAAVLLLIFRDTILGFVAGIQIAANRMFNSGDWIEIPKFNIDGEILQIGLNVVKVQNWDKTIATIPTYALTNESVRNWRGMQYSGGRRIKRALLIDQSSIAFLTPEQCEDLTQFKCIASYIKDKRNEISQDNQAKSIADNDARNARRMTNIGTFRAYINAYLRQRSDIHQDMTLMVRQLKPSETGLPLEIYCFTNTTEWVRYEGIQADIFDHVLAVMPLFGLRTYQRVSDKPA
jgi:miniconductance mechanosensitive channel